MRKSALDLRASSRVFANRAGTSALGLPPEQPRYDGAKDNARRAVEKAKQLITGRQYVLDSDWGDVQPNAAAENAYLESHSWDEYGEWHLGLTEGSADDTKARHAFVYGDFRRLHRTGIIACHYRAAEWRHKEIELAAHELLQLLDETSA